MAPQLSLVVTASDHDRRKVPVRVQTSEVVRASVNVRPPVKARVQTSLVVTASVKLRSTTVGEPAMATSERIRCCGWGGRLKRPGMG
jgi:hypothetical protein